MAKNVYLFPNCIAARITMGPQNVLTTERTFFGVPTTQTEVTPRRRVTIECAVVPHNFVSWETFADRLGISGGGATALFAMTNQTLRLRQGWDDFPAVNSSGTEYWRENGATEDFPGGTPGSPWRTAAAQAFGAASANATSIAVDGLLANETIKAGTPIRIAGLWNYIVRTSATANGSGEATLALAHPLRSAVSDNETVTIPGDLAIYDVVSYTPGVADEDNAETFSIEAVETYASEVSGGVTWVVD